MMPYTGDFFPPPPPMEKIFFHGGPKGYFTQGENMHYLLTIQAIELILVSPWSIDSPTIPCIAVADPGGGPGMITPPP